MYIVFVLISYGLFCVQVRVVSEFCSACSEWKCTLMSAFSVFYIHFPVMSQVNTQSDKQVSTNQPIPTTRDKTTFLAYWVCGRTQFYTQIVPRFCVKPSRIYASQVSENVQ